MLTNINLITDIAKEKKPTFISTGMSNYNDITKAIKIKKFKCDFTILHCVSTYPCKAEDLNLSLIQKLKKI